MDSPAAHNRNWNCSNLIDAFFGMDAAVAMHETGEAAFKRQLYQSMIAQTLYAPKCNTFFCFGPGFIRVPSPILLAP